MGFDVFGPTRHVRASNVDDGDEPRYDILALAAEYGLNCPRLTALHRRFYDSTTLRFADGEVNALHGELIRLRDAYRARREPELIAGRRIYARDPEIRLAAVERAFQKDTVYGVLEELLRLCEEAIAAEADVRCEGD